MRTHHHGSWIDVAPDVLHTPLPRIGQCAIDYIQTRYICDLASAVGRRQETVARLGKILISPHSEARCSGPAIQVGVDVHVISHKWREQKETDAALFSPYLPDYDVTCDDGSLPKYLYAEALASCM